MTQRKATLAGRRVDRLRVSLWAMRSSATIGTGPVRAAFPIGNGSPSNLGSAQDRTRTNATAGTGAGGTDVAAITLPSVTPATTDPQ